MSIQWGYSLSAWDHEENSVRKDRNERTFKTISAAGFTGVELIVGSGRWCPLGRPSNIQYIYGDADDFNRYLKKTVAIDHLITWDYDPGAMAAEEDSSGRNPSDLAQHSGIVDATEKYVAFLAAVNSKFLVVRPMLSWWKANPVTDEKIKAAADCWNKVGKMASSYGVKILMRIDWLCAANNTKAIELLMAETDPATVGLCINTGELAMVGIDPIALYKKYADRVGLLQLKDARTADTLEEFKKPFAEDIKKNGGERKIDRWFWEMGRTEQAGLVDFKGLMKAIRDHGYDGWIVVESDQSSDPAASVLYNSWYVQNILMKD
jgi:inosose dehydratase